MPQQEPIKVSWRPDWSGSAGLNIEPTAIPVWPCQVYGTLGLRDGETEKRSVVYLPDFKCH